MDQSFLFYFLVYYLRLTLYLLVQFLRLAVVAAQLRLQLSYPRFQVSNLLLELLVVAWCLWRRRRFDFHWSLGRGRWRGRWWWGLLRLLSFSPHVLSSLVVEELVVFLAVCHFSIALHIPMHPIMNLFIFPHIFNFALDAFKRREVSEIIDSIVLNNLLGVSHSTHFLQNGVDLCDHFFVAVGIFSLLLVPHLDYFSGSHMLDS